MATQAEIEMLITARNEAQAQFARIEADLRKMGVSIENVGRSSDTAARGLSNVDRSMDSAAKSSQRFNAALAGVAAGISNQLVGAGINVAQQAMTRFVDEIGNSIDAASDLQESMSKNSVVFEQNAREVEAWSKTSATAFGQSQQQALEAAASFGNLFTTMGLSSDAASQMSMDITELASDLASFHNIGVDEALEKLRSGLVGETEPMRQLGVVISETAVSAKGLEMGLAATAKELTEADKVMARYALIMEQTSKAQGDFARTSDNLANQQRTLQANIENLRAEFGQALLPAMTQVTALGNNAMIPMLSAMASEFGQTAAAATALGESLGDSGVGGAFSAMGVSMTDALKYTTAFGLLIEGQQLGLGEANRAVESFNETLDFLGIKQQEAANPEFISHLQAIVAEAAGATTAIGELGTVVAGLVTEGAREAAAATDQQTQSYIRLKTAAIEAMDAQNPEFIVKELATALEAGSVMALEFSQSYASLTERGNEVRATLFGISEGAQAVADSIADLTPLEKIAQGLSVAVGDWGIAQGVVNDAVSGASANAQIWQRDLSDIEKAQKFYNDELERNGELTPEQIENLELLNSAHGRVSDGLEHYQEIEAEAIVQREKFRAVQDELNKKLEDGLISQEDYDQAMRDTTLAMGGQTDVMGELGRIIGEDLVGAIDDLITGLRDLMSQEWKPEVDVDTDQAQEDVDGIQTRLEFLDGMGVTTEVYADVSAAEAEINRIMGIIRSGATLPVGISASGPTTGPFAEGGISTGGVALVGERGPELVFLPAGSEVLSNRDTRRYLGAFADGTGSAPRPIGVPGGSGGGAYDAGANAGSAFGQGFVDAAIEIIDKETYQMAFNVGDKAVSAMIEAIQTGSAGIDQAIDAAMSGAIGDADEILSGLLDAWNDIQEEIARQGLLGNDTAALEQQLAVIEAIIREWAERAGFDAGTLFTEGFVAGFQFPEALESFGDGITSWFEDAEEDFKQIGKDAANAFIDGFEDRFNEGRDEAVFPGTAGEPERRNPFDDMFVVPGFGEDVEEAVGMAEDAFASLEQLFSETPELVDDMLDDILRGVQEGALTWEQAMQLMARGVDTEMIPALERLEEQWTAQLAQAIIDGDAEAIESLQELLAWIDQVQAGLDGATEAAEKYGAQLGDTFAGTPGTVDAPTTPGEQSETEFGKYNGEPIITDPRTGEQYFNEFYDGRWWRRELPVSPNDAGRQAPITVHNTIVIDGEPVARSVMRQPVPTLSPRVVPPR